jgi:hypothetical protein
MAYYFGWNIGGLEAWSKTIIVTCNNHFQQFNLCIYYPHWTDSMIKQKSSYFVAILGEFDSASAPNLVDLSWCIELAENLGSSPRVPKKINEFSTDVRHGPKGTATVNSVFGSEAFPKMKLALSFMTIRILPVPMRWVSSSAPKPYTVTQYFRAPSLVLPIGEP